jgi:hypothetical protein
VKLKDWFMSLARQALGIYMHGDKVLASPTHGGKVPTHGGTGSGGTGPVHGDPNLDTGASVLALTRQGVNVGEHNYFSYTHPFYDITSGFGQAVKGGTFDQTIVPEANRATDGWANSLTGLTSATGFYLFLQPTIIVEQYELKWDVVGGAGTGGAVTIFNPRVAGVQSGNKITFTPKTIADRDWSRVDITNPSDGSHFANFRCFPVGYDPVVHGVLRPEYVAKHDALTGSRGVTRSMKWSRTSVELNNEPNTAVVGGDYHLLRYPELDVQPSTQLLRPILTSANRNIPGYFDWWNKDGVPIEYRIALCNATNTDLIVNVPWNADASYITAIATAIRDGANGFAGLKSSLRIIVVRVNEVWNFDYSVAQQCLYESRARWMLAGSDVKTAVRLVATVPITLSGTQTVDGKATVNGDRVIAAAQVDAKTNGVYVAAAGAWLRATDADATGEILSHDKWRVTDGTSYTDRTFYVSTLGTITLGTTNIAISEFTRELRFAEKSKEAFDLFATVFAATPTRLVRCLEWQLLADLPAVQTMIDYLPANSWDAWAVAPYYGNTGDIPGSTNLGQGFTGTNATMKDVLLQYIDLTFDNYVDPLRTVLTAIAKELIFYEGGNSVLLTDATTLTRWARSQEAFDVEAYYSQRKALTCGDITDCVFLAFAPITGVTSWGLAETVADTLDLATAPKALAQINAIAGIPTLFPLVYAAQSIAIGAVDNTALGSAPKRTVPGTTYSITGANPDGLTVNSSGRLIAPVNASLTAGVGKSVTVLQTSPTATNGPTLATVVSYNVVAAAWTPSHTAGAALVARWDVTDISTLFKDNAGTTPVLVDGDNVNRINDTSGNGHHLFRVGGTLTYRSVAGKSWVETSNALFWTVGGGSFNPANASGEMSYGSAVQFTNNTGTQLAPFAWNNFYGLPLRNVTGALQSEAEKLAGGNIIDVGPAITAAANVRLMSVLSTTALDTFVNGASNGSTAVANTLYNGAADDLVVFQLGGSMQFSGRLMRAIIASGAIDSTDRASLDTWLNAAF